MFRPAKILHAFSFITRVMVILVVTLFAFWNNYLNLKVSYNSSRLVGLHYEQMKWDVFGLTEINAGTAMKSFYEVSESFFTFFGDPIPVMQTNSGYLWAMQIFGVPITDPIAWLSVLVKDHSPELGFTLGLLLPIALALVFGRVFCAYVCPASLLFLAVAKVRQVLSSFFYFPQIKMNKGFAWGILIGGLLAVVFFGHGLWAMILPYLAMNQIIFQSILYGTLSFLVVSVILFALLDLVLGYYFTCRYLCPTGRLLGAIGSKAFISVRRDSKQCHDHCNLCAEVCPMDISPKLDETKECSLCSKCVILCPTRCLTLGKKPEFKT